MEAKLYALLEAILTTYTERVPKGTLSNYIFFSSNILEESKALDGYSGLMDQDFTIELFCRDYSSLKTYFASIRNMLKSIEQTTQTYFIQNVEINSSCPESWDEDIGMNRKILSVTLSYQGGI